MYDHIRGQISFRAEGDGYEKFLNDIRDKNAVCFDIRNENGVLHAKTYRNHYRAIELSAADNGIVLTVEKQFGAAFTAFKYRKRYGIFTGIIIAVAMLFVMSNYVIKIEISGNHSVDDERVNAVLEECGVGYGKFIPDINLEYVKRRLTLVFDEFSWVGVRSSGGRFIVEVTESTQKPDMVPPNQVCNIVSDRDGQITAIEVYSGEAAVRVGDGVAKGQLLISGIDVNKNDLARFVRADGKITAQYTDRVEFFLPLEATERMQTDEKTSKAIKIWGASIPLGKSEALQGDYEMDESTAFFSLGNFTLPIGITHRTYRIYEEKTVMYTPISAKEKLGSQLSEYEELFLSDKEIIDKKVTFSSRDNGIVLTAEYILESEIGVRQNIIDGN